MSWSKVKTMLIVLFIFVNGFMLYNLYFKHGSSPEVSAETVADTVSIMENNNVTIDPAIIRRKANRLRKAEISNSIDARSTLAENLLGSCIETETGYISDEGKLTFNSVAFSFENYNSEYAKPGINENNAINLASDLLVQKGFDVKKSDIRDFYSSETGFVAKFGKDVDGFPVYECYLHIYISPEGVVTRIDGYWPEVFRDNYSSAVTCINETAVLINLLTAQGFDTSKKNEVVDIQTGYTLGGLPESDSPIMLTLLPSYRVILKNGENYIFNAENGEFIYEY